MQVDISSVVLFLVAVLYLIMLPGYLIILALRLRELDLVEALTASFGIGVSVLAALSITLSVPGSIGLSFLTLIITNTAFLIVVSVIVYVRRRPKRDARREQENAFQA